MIDIKHISVEDLHNIILQLERNGFVRRLSHNRNRRDYSSWDWSESDIRLSAKHGVCVSTTAKWRKILAKPPVKQTLRDYKNWDWSKRDVELARQHDTSPVTVGQWRMKLGHPKTRKYKYLEWDYTKPDAEIAREHKVPIASVRAYRIKLNKPILGYQKSERVNDATARGLFDDVDWISLDWKTPDVELARKIGCSREYVRQKRALLGIPKNHAWKRKYELFLELVNGKQAVRPSDVESLCLSNITFSKYCTMAGVKKLRATKGCNPIYSLMNWALPNNLLTEIWKIKKAGNAVASHRCNFHLQKPLFHHLCKHGHPAEFDPMIEAERVKAEKYFASLNE